LNILIIDVGSSSIRALLFDYESALISQPIIRRDYQFNSDATCDAHQLRQLVESCVDEILAQSSYPIQTVGMTTFVGNVLGVDDKNKPLTPLYTYAHNQASESAKILINLVDNEAVHQRTGCRIHTAYHPAKLNWLKTIQPDLFSQVAQWVDFATYCYREWFGHGVPCSYSIASWSGLLNRHTNTWDLEWQKLLGLRESHLPHLADYDNIQQGLALPYANRWASLKSIPFYLGIGDGAGANIGSGGVSPNQPVLTVGTTAAMRISTPNMMNIPSPLWSYRIDKNHHLVGGSTNEGGNIFAWAKNTLNLTNGGIEAQLASNTPAPHGLIALPLFNGERSPYFHESARGTIHGITIQTTPLDIIRALLEGVALRLRIILAALNTPSDFILAGGGALHQSPAWAQIFADVLERPLYTFSERETSAYGTFLLIRYGGIPHIPQTNQYDRQFFPRPEHTSYYADLAEKQNLLYQQLYHKG